jgi:hypothetical protein
MEKQTISFEGVEFHVWGTKKSCLSAAGIYTFSIKLLCFQATDRAGTHRTRIPPSESDTYLWVRYQPHDEDL